MYNRDGDNNTCKKKLVIAGVSGGAVLPPIQAVIHDNVNVNVSFVIPLIAFVVVLSYGLVGHRWVRYVDDPIVNPQNEIETEKAD